MTLPGTALRTRRYLYIVFFVFCATVLVALGGVGVRIAIGSSWESFSQERTQKNLRRAVEAFESIQRSAERVAITVSGTPSIRSALHASPPAVDTLFSVIQAETAGIEVYDRSGNLAAWSGPGGPGDRLELSQALRGKAISRVDRTPIYRQLVAIVPVRYDSAIVGAVLVRRTFDVNYPVENKFVDGEDLPDELSASLGVPVTFDFTPDAEPTKDGRYAAGVLHGIDGGVVGVVQVGVPLQSLYIDGISTTFERITSVCIALLAGLLAFGAMTLIRRLRSTPVRLLLLVAVLWLTRYVLLWVEFPSNLFSAGIFEPAYFASQFLGGIAKSIGELTLTAITLTLTVWFIISDISGRPRRGSPHVVVGVVLSVLGVALILFLLRGSAAIVRSSVYDSTLKFLDPKAIVPSPELGLMVFNLFAVGVALIAVSCGVVALLVSLFSGKIKGWIIVFVVFILGSAAFELFHPSPMSSFWYRLAFGAGIMAFAYYVRHAGGEGVRILSMRNFLVALGLAGVFVYPMLVEQANNKDRDRIQAFASVVLRPSDSWLKYLVQESLRGFLDLSTEDILANGQREDIDQLAFAHWVTSAVNREGYSSLFAIVDADGNTESSFQIGGGELQKVEAQYDWRNGNGSAGVFEGPGGANKVYIGSVPIPEHSERPFAYAIVIVAAGKQELIREENLPFLRSDQQERIQSFYRPIVVTEYQNGVLVATRNNTLSMNYRLPEALRKELLSAPGHSVWVGEMIGGRSYQSLYVQAAGSEDRVIALTVRDIDLSFQLYNILKFLVYYTVIVVLLLFLLAVARLVRKRRYRLTFRDRLLVALVLTAFIPLAIIAVYSKGSAEARMLQGISNRLERETGTVESLLRGQAAAEESDESSPGATVFPDYNYYVGNRVTKSTRPELFEAGLLDTRLSGSAYDAVVVEQKRFFIQTETMGRFRYVVGYRPVLDSQGRVLGVIAVPTLYRQDQIETDLAQRNALLFGVLAFMLLVVGFVATAVANRLAGPIHRLTDATKRVSRGDLDVSLEGEDQEGEVGELIRSFGKMTKDLKTNSENVVRYERELAWKEMAKQVAHEIKNPLTPMKLSLQHLQQVYRDGVDDFGKAFDDVIKTVIDQIDGLSRIASEFSNFARMPARKTEILDVNAVIMEAASLFEGEKNVVFTHTLADNLPSVLGDHEELRRAFVNIIRNGIQAMSGSGRVMVVTRLHGAGVHISFSDTGPGIPDEIKSKLFEPNFSTKTEGMGLGLAIVKKTIDEIGGTIGIESVPGAGATVNITLPEASSDRVPPL